MARGGLRIKDAPAMDGPSQTDGPVIDRRRWAALVVLCVGQLMIVLDVTVVNVALPSIQRDLHFSQASLAWVVNAYLLTFGGLMLLAGRLGDVIGRRRVFVAGIAAFTVASFLCGLANSAAVLIAARFVQGAAAAFMASMILGILVTMFPAGRERGTAMGVYAFVASAGGSIGLLAGGVLTEALTWHWIFFINIPIGIAALVLGMALIDESPGLGFRHGVDVLGAALAVAAPTLAVYTIVNAGDWGWSSLHTIAFGALAVALFGAFVAAEAIVPNPLMPLRIFRSRTRSVANGVRALFAVGMFGAFFMGALYLQHVLGYSAIRTGLAFLPLNLTIGVFSLGITARVMARIGPKATFVPGLLLAGTALVLFARMPVHGRYVADVLPPMLVFGLGAGLAFTPGVALAMADAGPSDSGAASGLANVTLQLGAALGLAVLASVSSLRTAHLVAGGSAPPAALTSGYHLAFLIGAGCLAVGVTLAAILLRSTAPFSRPGAEARATDLASA
jgi:EmrB/QacA subfamily drug resistance transporter